MAQFSYRVLLEELSLLRHWNRVTRAHTNTHSCTIAIPWNYIFPYYPAKNGKVHTSEITVPSALLWNIDINLPEDTLSHSRTVILTLNLREKSNSHKIEFDLLCGTSVQNFREISSWVSGTVSWHCFPVHKFWINSFQFWKKKCKLYNRSIWPFYCIFILTFYSMSFEKETF